MVAARAHSARPVRVADELRWDLLRDEWDLLLAVGAGPTSAEVAARRLGEDAADVQDRIDLLVEHELLDRREGGYSLVQVFHQRQEGMASYLRDLVMRRVDLTGIAPLAGRYRHGLGGIAELSALLERADEELFPKVVELANQPETDESRRFSVYFAVAHDCPPASEAGESAPDRFLREFLRILRTAAVQRSPSDASPGAKLWVAEMRVDPEVAFDIGDVFETFLTETPRADAVGTGACVYAILPSGDKAAPKRGT